MASIVLISILFLLILIIGHEFGHFISAKIFRLRVDEFGFGFPPRLFSLKKGETRYSFNLLPFGGFVKIYGEHQKKAHKLDDAEKSFFHQPAWKRSIIIIAGAFMNFLIGWIAFSTVFSFGLPNRVLVNEVVEGGPAEVAGLEAGEFIEGYSSSDEFIRFIDENRGEEIEINGKTVLLRQDFPEGEGPLGIVFTEVGVQKESLGRSLVSGFDNAYKTTWAITKSFAGIVSGIFTGDFEMAGQVSGPVGVFGMITSRAEMGVIPLIQFLGLISLNLVVINLIPFPALDGGRFVFTVVEKIVGRKINQNFETAINGIGILLLLLLMIIVTARDIINIL